MSESVHLSECWVEYMPNFVTSNSLGLFKQKSRKRKLFFIDANRAGVNYSVSASLMVFCANMLSFFAFTNSGVLGTVQKEINFTGCLVFSKV